MQLAQQLAHELGVKTQQIDATIALIDEGATIPFIARYRKEVTGALDDGQLRQLHTRLLYLRDLDSRRQTILEQLQSQIQLSDSLKQALLSADTKARLEDLYKPYRPKRRSQAQDAREAGLQPLADMLRQQPTQSAHTLLQRFLQHHATDLAANDALDGARHILLEELSEQPDLVSQQRLSLWKLGVLTTRAARGKADSQSKFRDYFEYAEPIARIPSHRALAILRGENEGTLKYALDYPESHADVGINDIIKSLNCRAAELSQWMSDTVHQCWKQKLQPQLENELVKRLRDEAEQAAIDVFARNLNDLLLAAPAGAKVTMGLDPGLRTGVKVAVVDATGRFVAKETIYPHVPHKQWDKSLATLEKLVKQHHVELIAIGNGTACRETEQLAKELISRVGTQVQSVVVNEAGASVYSASELAANEFPDLDVTIRGAISIARRLQDPLAELVKIDPRSIGVGQYQHDVNQQQLSSSLDSVVESCVNHVGVDLNTASAALLTHVSGLNSTLANNIVETRDELGAFRNRKALLKVKRLGPKAYEQCAGFLRIRDGEEPLDNSAVHPESYPLADLIAKTAGCSTAELIRQTERIKQLNPSTFEQAGFGHYTVKDTLQELEKPGRDPRPEFRSVSYREGVETLSDLEIGMVLEGVVTNVTHFGAFVDIGVHQDGLVHISQLSDQFVQDPHSVVSSGQIVKVTVVEVDAQRKRIALSMRSQAKPASAPTERPSAAPAKKQKSHSQPQGALAQQLRAAGIRVKS